MTMLALGGLHRWIALAGTAALVAAACGGRVEVDTTASGVGGTTAFGAGGASTLTLGGGGTITGSTVVTTTPASTGTGILCSTQQCAGTQDGCGCTQVCNSQKLEIECAAVAGGAVCVCTENGADIAKCQDSALICDVVGSCCGAQFFGK